jgi:hypothetical protein
MATRRFRRLALAQLIGFGCSVVLGGGVLIELAQAQQQFVPPPPPPVTPPPAPVVNPPSPNRTVPQPSYAPVAPTTPSAAPGNETTSPAPSPETTPAKETQPSAKPRESERTHVAKTRPAYRHYRGRSAAPVVYRCGPYGWGFYGCVRTYTWAFPCQYYSAYCYPNYGLYSRYRY